MPSVGSGTRAVVVAKYDSHTLNGSSAATAGSAACVALAAAAADMPLIAMRWRSNAATSSD
eukprot:3638898-Prymnesium_polylepis.1